MTRKAKIVATIGPASQDEDVLEKLIEAGMNVARMNFSHGTHEQHAERIALIRKVSKKLDRPVGILQDLQGPKIRVGQLDEPVQLSEGETVILYVTGTTPPDAAGKKIPGGFPPALRFRSDLRPGSCSTTDASPWRSSQSKAGTS
ncbi:MAG: pyruvate kinase [Candidatus Moduliflexus flocculans]|nr:pyruvate kinase [Candidatus Moduliflexus flocculans]